MNKIIFESGQNVNIRKKDERLLMEGRERERERGRERETCDNLPVSLKKKKKQPLLFHLYLVIYVLQYCLLIVFVEIVSRTSVRNDHV